MRSENLKKFTSQFAVNVKYFYDVIIKRKHI